MKRPHSLQFKLRRAVSLFLLYKDAYAPNPELS